MNLSFFSFFPHLHPARKIITDYLNADLENLHAGKFSFSGRRELVKMKGASSQEASLMEVCDDGARNG